MIVGHLSRPLLVCLLGVGLLTGSASWAAGQALGVYRWQLQPYCNVLNLSVTQQGAVYTLDGFDDQCGLPQRATVVGLAVPNPDGTIGFGLTLVTVPGGVPLHVDAIISFPSMSGTWRDSDGQSGSLILTTGEGSEGRGEVLSSAYPVHRDRRARPVPLDRSAPQGQSVRQGPQDPQARPDSRDRQAPLEPLVPLAHRASQALPAQPVRPVRPVRRGPSAPPVLAWEAVAGLRST